MPKIFLTKKEVREMGELARDRLDKLKFVGSSAKARVTIDAVIERGTLGEILSKLAKQGNDEELGGRIEMLKRGDKKVKEPSKQAKKRGV